MHSATEPSARPRIPSPQQRRMARVQCSFLVTCRHNGREFAATVRDIGLEGMRLEMPVRVEPGHVVTLTYDNTLHCYNYDTIRVRVVWSRQRPFSTHVVESGVSYLETGVVISHSWVRHLLRVFDLDHLSARERREEIRVPSTIPGRLVHQDELIEGRVLDLGIGGALFDCPIELAVGTLVSFEAEPLPDGTVLSCDAHVVRRRSSKVPGRWLTGLRFAGPREKNYEQFEPQVARLLYGAEA